MAVDLETMTIEVGTDAGPVLVTVSADPGKLTPAEFGVMNLVMAQLPRDTEEQASLAAATASVVMQVLRVDPEIAAGELTQAVYALLGGDGG